VLRYQGAPIDHVSRGHYDVRAGVGARFGAFDLQCAWVGSAGGAFYAFGYPESYARRQAIVFTVARVW
jgi:hypothetical protein